MINNEPNEIEFKDLDKETLAVLYASDNPKNTLLWQRLSANAQYELDLKYNFYNEKKKKQQIIAGSTKFIFDTQKPDEEKRYIIEEIVNYRISKRKSHPQNKNFKKMELELAWRGYDELSWEPFGKNLADFANFIWVYFAKKNLMVNTLADDNGHEFHQLVNFQFDQEYVAKKEKQFELQWEERMNKESDCDEITQLARRNTEGLKPVKAGQKRKKNTPAKTKGNSRDTKKKPITQEDLNNNPQKSDQNTGQELVNDCRKDGQQIEGSGSNTFLQNQNQREENQIQKIQKQPQPIEQDQNQAQQQQMENAQNLQKQIFEEEKFNKSGDKLNDAFQMENINEAMETKKIKQQNSVMADQISAFLNNQIKSLEQDPCNTPLSLCRDIQKYGVKNPFSPQYTKIPEEPALKKRVGSQKDDISRGEGGAPNRSEGEEAQITKSLSNQQFNYRKEPLEQVNQTVEGSNFLAGILSSTQGAQSTNSKSEKNKRDKKRKLDREKQMNEQEIVQFLASQDAKQSLSNTQMCKRQRLEKQLSKLRKRQERQGGNK